MTKRIACIYNAKSGSAVDKEFIEQQFQDLGIDIDFITIQSGVESISRKLNDQSYTYLIAAGGDGTVRLTAQLATQVHLPLGILPLGTLNHFAKDLGLPIGLAEAAKVIANEVFVKVDYCTVNEQVFLNNASIGIYPAIVTDREKTQHLWGKWIAAFKASLTAIHENKNLSCTINTPEGNWEFLSPLIFAGNNMYDVHSSGLSGRSKLDNAKIFLYVVRATRRRKLILLALLSLFGVRLSSVETIKSTNGPITIRSNQTSVAIALDGEVFELKFPLLFKMNACKLTVLGVKQG